MFCTSFCSSPAKCLRTCVVWAYIHVCNCRVKYELPVVGIDTLFNMLCATSFKASSVSDPSFCHLKNLPHLCYLFLQSFVLQGTCIAKSHRGRANLLEFFCVLDAAGLQLNIMWLFICCCTEFFVENLALLWHYVEEVCGNIFTLRLVNGRMS